MEPQNTTGKLVPFPIFQYGTLFLLIIMMTIMNSLSSTNATNLGNETDLLALVEFKSQIADGSHELFRSWTVSTDHCKWPGVTCGRRHQRVVALDLQGQELSGSITPHMGNLSFLRYIDFSHNRVHGEIPQEIRRLSRLKHLILRNNTLAGTIPINLSYCKELSILDLRWNNITGDIPFQLGSLKKLTVLWLGVNNFMGEIPNSLGNLSSLERFSVAYNNLQGSIPDELGKLTSLNSLQVSANRLSGNVPPSLYNISSINSFSIAVNLLTGNLPRDFGSTLPNLKELYVAGNRFSGTIPASIANASKIQKLEMSTNTFTGQVPNNLGLLSNLNYLNLEINQLGGNPTQDLSFLESLSNCSTLEMLSLVANNFEGQLPTSIANFSIQMSEFRIGFNKISGPIPEALGSLVNLFALAMHHNLFSGVIPSSFGGLQRLQQCLLYNNQLSGQIPSSLGNISQLGELLLHNNRLEGSIPESVEACQNLQYLQLGNNNLFGLIPPGVFAIPSLLILDLSNNSLSGPLPAQVGRATNMHQLVVSNNNLRGEIPAIIGDCLSLEILDMDGNAFVGSIPTTLASLKGLQHLDLSQNNLSGKILTNLGSLKYLNYLNLSFNDFEGEIPTNGVFGNASAISVVGNGKLCGGIPDLKRPPCPKTKVKKKQKIAFAYKLTISFVCVCFFLAGLSIIGILYWKRKKTEVSVSSFGDDKFMRISYRELYKATEGFSSENLIGAGSFGSVYKGKLEQREDKLIAVKVLNLRNTRAFKSFMAESRILRNVRHRNLLKILTYCSCLDPRHNDFKALVYEFMPKGNLDMWLHPDTENNSSTLSLLQRLDIAIDIATALQYLHSHCETPIVHCDLKPSNILLDDGMCAHVGDFGLARFRPKVTSDVSEVSSIGIKGSIGYAAPEYGTGSDASACGDIYSYGIILLEMMTGRRPTDDIFKDGLNLHNYVKRAVPKQLGLIIDPVIVGDQQMMNIEEEELHENNDEIVEMGEYGGRIGSSYQGGVKLKTCIVSILTIALACSDETSMRRMHINDVVRELHHVRDAILGRGRNTL